MSPLDRLNETSPDVESSQRGPVSSSQFYNIMRPGDKFDYDVYLSFHSPYAFFERNQIAGKKPEWSEKDLFYSYVDSNKRELNLTIPVNENLRRNHTLYLHMQFTM